LNLKKRTCIERKELSGVCLELPVINHAFANRQGAYRFVYGCGVNESNPTEFYNQIVKIDTESVSAKHWYKPNHYPGEPVFVANPDARTEDDGVLLSVVLDAQNKQSYLLVLNAMTFEEMAKASLPHTILFGYHGTFLYRN
jgi:carotenoid cleavage dioxygenase-like enzyme